jgi:hypothetical protein
MEEVDKDKAADEKEEREEGWRGLSQIARSIVL